MTGPRQVVLALGSNLGDPLANLQAGVDHLAAAPGLRCTAVSGIFVTAPVGGPPQPDYLNAVLLADSDRRPARSLNCATPPSKPLAESARNAGDRVPWMST